jgi:excinuclease ABC subunit A
VVLTFPVELPASATAEEVTQWLSASGFTRVQAEREIATPTGPRKVLDVVADRFRIAGAERARVIEAIEVALKRGSGRLTVYALAAEEGAASEIWRFSTGLHCPESDIRYGDPIPSMFSFNSAVGACETCRGFGRVIGVDLGLVIPNDKLTLRAGAIKTIQTPAWKEAQDDLMRHAEAAGIPRDTPWNKLTPEQQAWVIEGSPNWKGKWNQQWYGVRRFFGYLESKAYKMHIRVLLSKYRSYTPCPTCAGARLKLESLLWRIGTKEDADAVLEPSKRFMPVGVKWSREQLEALPGLCLHDLMLLPIERLRRLFDRIESHGNSSTVSDGDVQALKLLFEEITHAPALPARRRHRLPHARPPEPHAQRRRGAAHQPHDCARHLAGQHAVRARRAQHRAASARHEPHHRGHAAPARRRQHAGGGGA